MAKPPAYKWTFGPRFRRHAFGWRSDTAVARVKEAVAEIKAMARSDMALAAEGAVLFIEKVSPALEEVDSSSGAIGSAVTGAVRVLADIIRDAPVDEATRARLLERLFSAYIADDVPYIERLGDCWGALCGTPELASRWADKLMAPCRDALAPSIGFIGGSSWAVPCLAALVAAGRYEEVLALLDTPKADMWFYRQFGVQALVALGRPDEAVSYADAGRNRWDGDGAISAVCEKILLDLGRIDEAYAKYGVEANQAGTYLAWFRAVAKKYPHKTKDEVLADLVAHRPGEEGKWFAAAKSAGLYAAAIELANRTPCSPKTLTTAARDFETKNPAFAVEAGLTAIRWLIAGYGFDVTSVDVLSAFDHMVNAAKNAGSVDATRARLEALIATGGPQKFFVVEALWRRLTDL